MIARTASVDLLASVASALFAIDVALAIAVVRLRERLAKAEQRLDDRRYYQNGIERKG